MRTARKARQAGFTLIELLVVILIILLVSAATLPVIVPALTHRQVGEAARLLQAALSGARDAAIRANEPRGIRLLPDPAFAGGAAAGGIYPALAYNRFVPIEPGPSYTEGHVSVWLLPAVTNAPAGAEPPLALRVEEDQYSTIGLPNARTSWFWNIRIGDKIKLGAGRMYTVVGPIWINPWSSSPAGQNPDLFVNVGPPQDLNTSSSPPITRTSSSGVTFAPEYLLLVNGQDDNGNGYVDEGFDGFDNNFNGVRDLIDFTEWEREVFSGSQFAAANTITGQTSVLDQPYVIVRRPLPSPGAREVSLPADVVIDATTWNAATSERSRLPVDPYTGYCDIMVAPNGQVVSMGATSSDATPVNLPFFHFWLTEREDVVDGHLNPGVPYLLPMPQFPATASPPYPNPSDPSPRFLKGDRRMVTLFPKTGQIITNAIENFDPTNVGAPFVNAQQGLAEEIK